MSEIKGIDSINREGGLSKEHRVFEGLRLRVEKNRGGHRHLQIGRMLDNDLISEPPHTPSLQMYVSKAWESVWPEGQEAIHS